jgi:hypothetical protein
MTENLELARTGQGSDGNPDPDAHSAQMPSPEAEARLLSLVLDGVSSVHSRRSYRTGLVAFFAWIRISSPAPVFSKGVFD